MRLTIQCEEKRIIIFPRTYIGTYEMIRVAGKAAIIIEPIDIINPYLINKVWKNRFSFE
jgi:hypothetical protein